MDLIFARLSEDDANELPFVVFFLLVLALVLLLLLPFLNVVRDPCRPFCPFLFGVRACWTAFANVMRQANVSPWVVESTSTGISQKDKHTMLQGMGSLLDGEAKGRVRRCSLLSIHDSLMSLSFAPEGDKNTAIADFLEARDKRAYLQKPEPSDTVRRREKTKRFEFEPSEKRVLKLRRLSMPKKIAKPVSVVALQCAPGDDDMAMSDVTLSLRETLALS